MANSIQEIALQDAKEWIQKNYSHLLFNFADESAIMTFVEVNYDGGWEAFYEHTFRQMMA